MSRGRRSGRMAALAGTVTLLASSLAWLAPSGAAASAGSVDGWTATGADLAAATGDAPGGRDATLLTATAPQPLATLAGAANPVAGKTFGVRGYVREVGGIGAVAQLHLSDSAGAVTSTAPIRLQGIWQSFGVTEPHAPAGAMGITVGPGSGASWSPGTAVEIAVASAAPVQPSVTARMSGTNEITLSVDGGTAQVYNPRGYVYWPMQIGLTWPANTWADPATCQADAQLLAGAGVTMVQAPFDPDLFDAATQIEQCADAFWAAGIGVAWLSAGLGGAESIEASPAYVPAYEQELSVAISDLAAKPATQFWFIGNEEDNQSNGGACFFDRGGCNDGSSGGGGHYLRQLVDYMHTNDPDHLVSTKMCCSYPKSTASPPTGCGPTGLLSPTDVPNLDFWSVDYYPYESFGGLFTCFSQDDSTRPVLLSEFGDGRYDCLGLDPDNLSGTVDIACPQGSHEQQDNQSTANDDMWNGLLAAEATASNPSGEVIGGTAFMYSDLWWYTVSCFGCESGTQLTHDVEAAKFTNYPANWWSSEWAGSSYAQNVNQSGQPRIPAEALTTVGQIWTGTTFPTVSNVVVTPLSTPTSTCQVQVTWTSATAATSIADWARDGLVTIAENGHQDPIADNTDFLDSTEDGTLTTTHSLVLSGDITPGELLHVVVRGFDASWRTAASQQVVVQVPTGACV